MASPAFPSAFSGLRSHPVPAFPENPPEVSSSAKPRVSAHDGLDWACPLACSPSPTGADPSPSPSSSPAPTSDAGSDTETPRSQTSTGPHRRTKSTQKSRKGPDHIPRPPNAWILFRSETFAQRRVIRDLERDHRHISRTIASMWKDMSDEKKMPYRLLAKEAAEEHRRRYPDYTYKPTIRAKRSRQTNRNGTLDLERDRRLAAILMNKELDDAAVKAAVAALDKDLERKRLELEPTGTPHKATKSKSPPVRDVPPAVTSSSSPPPPPAPLPFPLRPPVDEPVFRSPLFPPPLPATTVSPVGPCEPVFFAENAGHTWNGRPVRSSTNATTSNSASLDVQELEMAQMLQRLNMQTSPTGFDIPHIPQVPQVPVYPQLSQRPQTNDWFGYTSGENSDPSYSNCAMDTNVLQDATFMQLFGTDFMDGAAPAQNMDFAHPGFESQPNFPPAQANISPFAFDPNMEFPTGEQLYPFGQGFDFDF